MKHLLKSLLVIAICAMPAIAMAQPESCTVKFSGNKPTIKDFAKAYCTASDDAYPIDAVALAALNKGNSKKCVVDTKNGYIKCTEKKDGIRETLEMTFWNCNNKNEKLIAVNHVSEGSGLDESTLHFYCYDVKTKEMKHIDPPFASEPQPIDMLNLKVASKKVVNEVKTAENEDLNKFCPIFKLPRSGKNITYRMADPNAVPKAMQRTGTLKWNGEKFSVVK